MGKVRIKWANGGLGQILNSGPVQSLVGEAAERIASGCNAEDDEGGFIAASSSGATRARAAVIASTGHAIGHNAKHNTLLKNLDKGR